MATNYGKGYLDNIVQATQKTLQKQKSGISDYMRQQALRTGQSTQDLAKALTPYAEAAGSAAAGAGLEAERLGQRKEMFETQQEAWEKQFAETQKQNQLNQMMAQFQATGVWTPEMIEAFGYDLSKSQQRDVQKQLGILGIEPGGGQAPWQGGPFGTQNRQLYQRAFQPGPRFGTTSQKRQQAWLQSQFG